MGKYFVQNIINFDLLKVKIEHKATMQQLITIDNTKDMQINNKYKNEHS